MVLFSYRELKEEDIPQIQEVALKAWEFTYRDIYAASTIKRQVGEYYSTESLKRALQSVKSKKSSFHVALDNDIVVGYASGGEARGTWRNPFLPRGRVYRASGWELFRIYLRPDYIGRGIGRELLRRWEAFLRHKRAENYSVYIHARNELGREFYLRNGFVRANELNRGPSSLCFVKTL